MPVFVPRRVGGRTLLEINPDDLVWALYARESLSVDERQVNDQLADLGPFALGIGGRIGGSFSEPDTSASKRRRVRLADGTIGYRVVREKWDDLMTRMRRGEFNALALDNLDRGLRDPRDLEDVIDLVEYYGVYVVGLTGSLDLTTDDGINAARNAVSQRNTESRNTGRRIAVGNRRAAYKGHVKGGGTRAYGWRKDKKRRNKREADILRAGGERLVAGVRSATLSTEWNARGIKTVTGARWRTTTVEQIFSNPRLCGWRVYKGEVLRDSDGNPIHGDWEPIFTEDEFLAISSAVRSHPFSRTGPSRGQRIRCLLTGFLRCGKCHGLLTGNSATDARTGRKYKVYRCPARSDGGCGGVTRVAQSLEEHIVALVIADQKRRQWWHTEPEQTAWEGQARLTEVQELMRDTTAEYKKQGRTMSAARYFAVMEELEAEEKELRAQQRRHTARQARRDSFPVDIERQWERPEFTFDQKREAIAHSIRSVIVHPAGRFRRFNPDLIEIVWSNGDTFDDDE